MSHLSFLTVGRKIAALGLLTAIAGCGAEDEGFTEGSHEGGLHDEHMASDYPGHDVALVPVGNHSMFRMVDMGSDVALIFQGDLEDAPIVEPLMKRVQQSSTYAEVYRAVSGAETVPESVLELDTKFAKIAEAEATVAPPEQSAESSDALAVMDNQAPTPIGPPGLRTLSHANPAADATINWTDDCTWFLNLAPNYCDERWSATSKLWAFSGHLESRQHWAILMAASHTFGTDVVAQQWNGSTWTNLYSAYIQPRHYVTLGYGSGTSAFKWRRFYNTGRGGSSARTHSHIGWNIEAPTGDIGRLCIRDYLCQSP